MSFFVPVNGISGPEMSVQEVCLDHDIEVAFSMAEDIYLNEVTNFLNGRPGFRHSTTKEQRAVYVLARALQTYARAMANTDFNLTPPSESQVKS